MSLITSLFCPLCHEPYDNEKRRPRLGSCCHSVCHQCIEAMKQESVACKPHFKKKCLKCEQMSTDHVCIKIKKREPVPPWYEPNRSTENDCPLCDQKNAFQEVSYNFELCKMLATFNEKVTEENFQRISDNPKKLDLGVCKSCLTTEGLRQCMTCAENSRLFKKLSNGKYQLMLVNQPLFIAKSVYFCSDCIADGQPDHSQHLFLPLSKIEMRDMDLEYWYFIIHALFLSKKMDEEVHRPIYENAQYYNPLLFQFKQQALSYEVLMKSNPFPDTEDFIKLKFKKHVDIMSVPELARAKEKSFEEAQKVINRYSKLQERQLWFQRYQINSMAEMFRRYTSKDPTFVKFKEDFSALANKYNTFQFAKLSQSEADQIDQLSDAKVEKAMQELDLPDLGPDKKKFYAYQAICNLLQDAEKVEKTSEKLKKEFKRFEKFFNDRYKKIEKEMKEDPLAQRLFLFEITEKSLKMDKLLIEKLEAECDWREGELIWERWFPDRYNAISEDPSYHYLLSRKFKNNCRSITDKFFSEASNKL